MIDDAERLDAALNRRRIGASTEDLAVPLRELVELAIEVGDACSEVGLTPAERERLYADALSRLDGAGLARWRWSHLTRAQAAALIGGAAAITAVAAAIGVRVIVFRHGHHEAHLAAA